MRTGALLVASLLVGIWDVVWEPQCSYHAIIHPGYHMATFQVHKVSIVSPTSIDFTKFLTLLVGFPILLISFESTPVDQRSREDPGRWSSLSLFSDLLLSPSFLVYCGVPRRLSDSSFISHLARELSRPWYIPNHHHHHSHDNHKPLEYRGNYQDVQARHAVSSRCYLSFVGYTVVIIISPPIARERNWSRLVRLPLVV